MDQKIIQKRLHLTQKTVFICAQQQIVTLQQSLNAVL